MKDNESDVIELTEDQRRLVDQNIGLVGVHLRRSMGNVTQPRRDREWEDLFQEGCLGLVKAAVRFKEERGIPFAAFAFPRIHNAVSRALQTKFATVYVPPARHSSSAEDSPGTGSQIAPHRPQVQSLTDELERSLFDRHHEADECAGESIGDRIRDKYDRAVHASVADVARGPSRRGDRERLARVIAEERFLIPGDESRTALRKIARDTNSSYARVAQCDKKLAEAIRVRLRRDPEFVELSRLAKSHPEGTGRHIDDALERELRDIATGEFTNRLRGADPRKRTQCIDFLVDRFDERMDSFLRSQFQSMAPLDRERFFQRTDDGSAAEKKRDVNRDRNPSRA